MSRGQVVVAGATGKRRIVHAPTRTAMDRQRDDVCSAISAEYSYAEILEFAAKRQRDRERAEEIADLFSDFSAAEQLEEMLYVAYQWQLARRREARLFSPPRKSKALLASLRRKYKAYYQRLIADPVRCAERRKKDAERYRRRYNDPDLREHIKRLALQQYKKHAAKRAKSHRAWQDRIRRERTAVYLKRLQKERERIARDYQDPVRKEKRRKAARECHARKRARLKQDPAAYRAFLDARNAKRTPNRAAPRWCGEEIPKTASAESPAEAPRPEDRGLHKTGWVASCDVYEALDAMAPGQDRYINGVLVRHVDRGARPSQDKLFMVDHVQNIGTEHFLPIAAAVRFVLNPPELVNPFKHITSPKVCPRCEKTDKRSGSAPWALQRCTPCGIEMCWECLAAHRKKHARDPDYREPPTAAELAQYNETFPMVAAILEGLKPFARFQMPGVLKLDGDD